MSFANAVRNLFMPGYNQIVERLAAVEARPAALSDADRALLVSVAAMMTEIEALAAGTTVPPTTTEDDGSITVTDVQP